ncbi:MAG: DNA translocase FtsK [Rhodothermia bacterium]|nr:DNA translocase FtsK [Rhodothermia bacterium]
MASSTVNKRRGTSPAPPEEGLVSAQRKKEVLGLILMVLGVLIAIAVLSYSPLDSNLAKNFSVREAVNPGDNRAQNALGLIGAWIAHGLVYNLLGYVVIVVPGLMFTWGYLMFRGRRPVYLPLVSTLVFIGGFVLSAMFGWLGVVFDLDTLVWSGGWGVGTAGWMIRVFGSVGALLLQLLSLTVVILLMIDRDIQRSIDRLEEGIFNLKESIKDWRARNKAHRQKRREELMELKDKRAAAREAEKERILAEAAAKAKAEAEGAARHGSPREKPNTEHRVSTARIYDPREKDERTLASGETTLRPIESARSKSLPAQPSPAEPAGIADDGQDDLTLTVEERIEEERSDRVQRPIGKPVEDRAFRMPGLELLDNAGEDALKIDYNELEENKSILLDKLATYNIEITDIKAIVGPTVTLYELTPAPGVKISRITALEDDLAMAMAARGIRMIAPIPGKSAIGVEIPNRHRELVQVRDLIGTTKFNSARMELPLILGKSIEGEVFIRDLTVMPHLLIAGATGSGKSVGLNACIGGLLYACHPANLKFVMIDPKKIELQQYARIVEHYIAMPEEAMDPIITDIDQALGTLKSCEKEMEERYDLLSDAQVRSVKEYNKRFATGKLTGDHRHLPYIVVVVDELADLMMTAGKDIEGPIARLAQMARAVGIHLILATQRPSVDVITGLIKANFPARIAYQVASKIDSRTILDQNGAQGLVGNGDLLYMLGSNIVRLQGPFVSVEEVDRLTEYIEDQKGDGPYILPSIEQVADLSSIGGLGASERDELFVDAARVIVRSQQGSVSLLQRKLSVGYSRAARIVDQLEDAGIVGPFEGSKARQVLVADEFELDEMMTAGKEARSAG